MRVAYIQRQEWWGVIRARPMTEQDVSSSIAYLEEYIEEHKSYSNVEARMYVRDARDLVARMQEAGVIKRPNGDRALVNCENGHIITRYLEPIFESSIPDDLWRDEEQEGQKDASNKKVKKIPKETLSADERNIQRMAHCSGHCDHPDRNCKEFIGDCVDCSAYFLCSALYAQGYRNAVDLLDEIKQEIEETAMPGEDEMPAHITLDDIMLGGDIVLNVLEEHKEAILDYRRSHEE